MKISYTYVTFEDYYNKSTTLLHLRLFVQWKRLLVICTVKKGCVIGMKKNINKQLMGWIKTIRLELEFRCLFQMKSPCI